MVEKSSCCDGKPTSAHRCQNKLDAVLLVSQVLALFVFILQSFDLSWMWVAGRKRAFDRQTLVSKCSGAEGSNAGCCCWTRTRTRGSFPKTSSTTCAEKVQMLFSMNAFIKDGRRNSSKKLLCAEHCRSLRAGQLSNCTSTPTRSVNTHHRQTSASV